MEQCPEYAFSEDISMRRDTKKKERISDIVGVCSGILLLAILVFNIVWANTVHTVGVRDSAVPESAMTVQGTADGRNGPITVEVVADQDQIYQLRVLSQEETDGIGSEALTKLPKAIINGQDLDVDAVGGATITSEALRNAIVSALREAGIDTKAFNLRTVKLENVAQKISDVEAGNSEIKKISSKDWAELYPNEYESWFSNENNSEFHSYLEKFPYLVTLYDGYGFAKQYESARGHMYVNDDVTGTARPHPLANCFTCKTPDFTVMTNNMGDAAYSLKFEDVMQQVNEPLGCYNCHANEPGDNPGQIVITHAYAADAVGEDFAEIDAANLACGQCHVEYYFAPDTKATTLPHNSLASMDPDAILDYYNNVLVDENGQGFADFTSPNTGIRVIKVQHPELETYLGEGSVHRGKFTCADCHMTEAVDANGNKYMNHFLSSPLENQELINNTCSKCHDNLVAEITKLEEDVIAKTTEVGENLVELHHAITAAMESGKYTEDELNAIRNVARDAQFYWDFVFVENSNGAHNSKLTYRCLDKAAELTEQAMGMFK